MASLYVSNKQFIFRTIFLLSQCHITSIRRNINIVVRTSVPSETAISETTISETTISETTISETTISSETTTEVEKTEETTTIETTTQPILQPNLTVEGHDPVFSEYNKMTLNCYYDFGDGGLNTTWKMDREVIAVSQNATCDVSERYEERAVDCEGKDQHVHTLTLRDLQTSDSGSYVCETGDGATSNELEITVKGRNVYILLLWRRRTDPSSNKTGRVTDKRSKTSSR